MIVFFQFHSRMQKLLYKVIIYQLVLDFIATEVLVDQISIKWNIRRGTTRSGNPT